MYYIAIFIWKLQLALVSYRENEIARIESSKLS